MWTSGFFGSFQLLMFVHDSADTKHIWNADDLDIDDLDESLPTPEVLSKKDKLVRKIKRSFKGKEKSSEAESRLDLFEGSADNNNTTPHVRSADMIKAAYGHQAGVITWTQFHPCYNRWNNLRSIFNWQIGLWVSIFPAGNLKTVGVLGFSTGGFYVHPVLLLQDASIAAGLARDKLIERQEKLEVLLFFSHPYLELTFVFWNSLNIRSLRTAMTLDCLSEYAGQDLVYQSESVHCVLHSHWWSLHLLWTFVPLAFYLQAINQQTQEMQVGAENFASIAAELAKKMETRKWYEFWAWLTVTTGH